MFTLNGVKQHLRVDHNHEDILIQSYMDAAQDYAESFLGRPLGENIPGTVLAGLLVHTALLYESREGEFIEKNLASVRLLYWPHRVVNV